MSESASIKTRPNARPAGNRPQQVDDYDDAPVQARPLSRKQQEYQEPAYDQYDQYEDEDYYEDDEEVAVVSINRRAVALIVSSLLVVGIFAVAIWILLAQNAKPTSITTVEQVPTITGFDPDTAKEDQEPKKGLLAPDFQWTENGKTVSLSSYRGTKPLFVNFWGTWCPPCKAEMPEMANLYNAHKNDIEIIGVSMGPRDWPEQVLSFVSKTTYNWKFIHDSDYKVATRYQVSAIPSSYFIDKNGVINTVHIGAMTGSMMEGYTEQVIK